MATDTQAQPTAIDAALAAYRQAQAHEQRMQVNYQVTQVRSKNLPERAKAHAAWMAASKATTDALRELVKALELEWYED